MLWEVSWVERFGEDTDCVEPCRRKVAMILSVLIDPDLKYLHDPLLAAWCVIALLKVERTARRPGLFRWTRPAELDSIEALLRDCEQHMADRRGLPVDLKEKLKILESRGVFLPSDLHAVLASFM
jgi:hypothetical protein